MLLYKRALALCSTLLMYAGVYSQNSDTVIHRRCATMEAMQATLQQHPELAAQWKAEGEQKYQNYLQRAASGTLTATRNTGSSPYSNAGNEIVIPVVVHIVLPNPQLVTDRDVYEQIEKLNIDYAGINADKSILPAAFLARAGNTRIRFLLARTDTLGAFTSGIERKTSSTTYSINSYNEVKANITGGMNAWDVSRYYNVWVTRFSDGVLGVSTFPYTTPQRQQGTVVNYIAFGNNPAYVSPSYNLGRTLVHETGHFFYLYHIWGDDDGACNGSDFDTQSGYDLPVNCTDDTPNQGNSSDGILAGTITDACNTTAPGINYQNYMDYSYDVSYGMFTTGQICRMENALTVYRSTLANSQTDIPPAGVNDAALVTLTPGIRSGLNIPVVCNGSAITARLRNLSNSLLTRATFTVQLDGVTVNTQVWTGSLAVGSDALVDLGAVNAITGNHTLTVFTTQPNNTGDSYTANDTLTRIVYINNASVTVPFTENFESATFPAAGWYISNPDNGTTWTRSTNAAASGTGSAVINNASNTRSRWDDLVTPPIDFDTDTDSSRLTFSVAYRSRGTSFYDALEVAISNNCGNDFVVVYRKTPPSLPTVSGTGSSSFIPNSAQWRRDTVDLTPYLVSGQKMIIRFRNMSGAGSNLYLDSIDVSKVSLTAIDATIQNVYAEDFLCNAFTIHPAATLSNKGRMALSSASIHYQLDNNAPAVQAWTGNLVTGDTTLITLPALTASGTGQHTVTVWVTQPNNTADGKPSNDTLYKGISIFGIVNAPLTESFEGTFVPESWGVYNPDNKTTWQKVRKAATLAQLSDTAAAVMTNFGYIYSNATDELRTPVVKYGTVDSLFLLFDVAAGYSAVAGTPDTLQVLVTSDCGATYQSVYKKTGLELQTVSGTSSGIPFTPSDTGAYRRDSINLTNLLPASGNFQVVFRSISNGRNNIYIDNVNIKTKVVLPALKEKGFLITPNPTVNGNFVIQHYQIPEKLTGVCVYDMQGRLVAVKNYLAGTAPAYLPVNIAHCATGIYIVKLYYTDHSYSTKLLKQ
ncbi:hypothetical protein HNQ91_002107 [Filimonas zeae]|nr:choice-of-anchor J domain-containing protein [Filimonas zeae]MDR6339056.1 hypothetical protein [Filimonas zeae]